jgi:hypothetical protein
MKVQFVKSDRKDKRLQAIFTLEDKSQRRVHFGLKNGSTYLDHGDDNKKRAWIARHEVRGTFFDPMTPSSLSRWILWNKTNITDSIKDYKNKFHFN